MTVTAQPIRLSLAELQAEIAQFYADHFYLLDSGQAQRWADTFTADGAFYPPHRPEPLRGRATLADGVAAAHQEYEQRGEQRRHWHGMVSVNPQPDGRLAVRCYAQIIVTPRGGTPSLHLSCVCHDVFVREDGRWLVAERRVTRDDRP